MTRSTQQCPIGEAGAEVEAMPKKFPHTFSFDGVPVAAMPLLHARYRDKYATHDDFESKRRASRYNAKRHQKIASFRPYSRHATYHRRPPSLSLKSPTTKSISSKRIFDARPISHRHKYTEPQAAEASTDSICGHYFASHRKYDGASICRRKS